MTLTSLMNTPRLTSPFLKTSREFPEEMHQLTVEVNRAYIDIASAVNSRIVSIFPTNKQIVTGEKWYIDGLKQQTERKIFRFTTTSSITHGIQVTDPAQFVRCFGNYTDGTNSYGLIYGTSVAIAGQILFYVTATQIVFVVGGGAPAITKGTIVLEWLSSV